LNTTDKLIKDIIESFVLAMKSEDIPIDKIIRIKTTVEDAIVNNAF